MNPENFEKRRQEQWEEFDRLLESVEKRKPLPGVETLPRRFRMACADLALARHRMYRGALLEHLNERVIQGYKLLYRKRGIGWERLVKFVVMEFPAKVREEWRLFWFCSLMFLLPFLGMMLSVKWDLSWVEMFLGDEQMEALEHMYGSGSDQVVHLRSQFGSNFEMFAHYVQNNIGIDFQIFAGGVLAGLGTVFFLVYNGLAIGASAGYVNHAGDPQAFWSFVAGHSSYELLGMVVAGMAGMRLGLGILRPGVLSRSQAIGVAARKALPLVMGAGLMTFVAALVEGFWSAQAMPVGLKYGVGLGGWVLHVVYFLAMGRRAG